MRHFWIDSSAHSQLCIEANQKAPLETGGLLIGYCSEDNKDVVVTNIIGPGPNAEHDLDYYIPDYDYHKGEAGRFFDESKGTLTYLGDWHSHPGGSARLSLRDKRALRNILLNSVIYIISPCMLLVHGNVDSWLLSAWYIYRKKYYISNKFGYNEIKTTIFTPI